MQRRAHRENQVSSRTQRVEVRNACSPRYPTVHAALHLRQLSLVPRRRGLLLRQRQELERGGSQGLQVHRVREPQGVRSDQGLLPVSYTHLRAHETRHDLVCRLLLEKKKNN